MGGYRHVGKQIRDRPRQERGELPAAFAHPFLERSALVYPAKPAIVDGERIITYADMWRRCRQAADALRKAGVGKDDTVSVLSPNGVAALEMHYAASMAGGVLNAINYRLDAKTVGFILEHAETKAFLVDAELMPVARAALADIDHRAGLGRDRRPPGRAPGEGRLRRVRGLHCRRRSRAPRSTRRKTSGRRSR